MIVKAGSDANGDGTFALADDKFGAFFTLQSGRAILYATGMKIATKNEQNEWSYNFWNDRFVERYDKTYKIINETTAVNYNGDGTAALNAFTTDRMLFYCNGLRQLTSLREMESDFGIVPYPLYDDKQEDYISYNFGTFFLAIPKSVKDPQLSAVVLEALNAESYKSVGPAYFEVNMKDKYSRDKTTMEMLDMIIDRIYFDFTFVNESATGHIAMFFFGQISGKNPNITSASEGQRASYDNQLKTMLEKAKAEKVG